MKKISENEAIVSGGGDFKLDVDDDSIWGGDAFGDDYQDDFSVSVYNSKAPVGKNSRPKAVPIARIQIGGPKLPPSYNGNKSMSNLGTMRVKSKAHSPSDLSSSSDHQPRLYNGNASSSNMTMRVKSKAATTTSSTRGGGGNNHDSFGSFGSFGNDADASDSPNPATFNNSFSNSNNSGGGGVAPEGSFSLEGFPRAAVASTNNSSGGQSQRASRAVFNDTNNNDSVDRSSRWRDRSVDRSSRRDRSVERGGPSTRGKSTERRREKSVERSSRRERSQSPSKHRNSGRSGRSKSPGKFRGNRPDRSERKQEREREQRDRGGARSQSPGKFRTRARDRDRDRDRDRGGETDIGGRSKSPGGFRERRMAKHRSSSPGRLNMPFPSMSASTRREGRRILDDNLSGSSHHDHGLSSADEQALGSSGSGSGKYRSTSPGRLSNTGSRRRAMEGRSASRRSNSNDDMLSGSSHHTSGQSSDDGGGGSGYRSKSPGRLSHSAARRAKSSDDMLGGSSHHGGQSSDDGGGGRYRSTSPGRLSNSGSRRRATEGRLRRKKSDDALGGSSHHTTSESSVDEFGGNGGRSYRSTSPGRLSNTATARRRAATEDKRRNGTRRTKSEEVTFSDFTDQDATMKIDESSIDESAGGRERQRGVSRSKSMDTSLQSSDDSDDAELKGEIEMRAVHRILDKIMTKADTKNPKNNKAALGSGLKFVDDQIGSVRKSRRPGDDRSFQSEGFANRHAGETRRRISRSASSKEEKKPASSRGLMQVNENDFDEDNDKAKETMLLMKEKRMQEEARLLRLQEEARLMEEKRLFEEARLSSLKEEARLLEEKRKEEEALVLVREQRLAEEAKIARLRENRHSTDEETPPVEEILSDKDSKIFFDEKVGKSAREQDTEPIDPNAGDKKLRPWELMQAAKEAPARAPRRTSSTEKLQSEPPAPSRKSSLDARLKTFGGGVNQPNLPPAFHMLGKAKK